MIDSEKCRKLVRCLQRLTSDLTNNKEYNVHSHINQFFYMQRAEELKLILEQFEEAKANLTTANLRMNEKYTSTYHQWKKDVRWLNAHLHHRR
jgi:hypothetical protein